MKITYFPDTDTLNIEFTDGIVDDTKDLDEDTLAEYDANGKLVSMIIEHASKRVDLSSFSYSSGTAIAA